jgi:hypothetical protein
MAVETLSKDIIVTDLMNAIRVAFPAVGGCRGPHSRRPYYIAERATRSDRQYGRRASGVVGAGPDSVRCHLVDE